MTSRCSIARLAALWCGAALAASVAAQETTVFRNVAVVPMGGLDDPPPMLPQAHIFVGSKAPWYEITDDLPRYEEYPT